MSKLQSLALLEHIDVDTSHGKCEVQLCFGSVTKLEKKDQVDVLVVSAFPDDYSPNPASVIGALYKDLGINVEELARDKEEDLRRLLSCWWSKPLAEEYSFERILCFEGCFKREVSSPVIVRDAFKALISMYKDKDIKVMMPLLTSKDKNYSHETMLRLMVEAGIHWMKIGLPLKVLKIVILARYVDEIEKNPLLHYFRDLKMQWDKTFMQEQAKPKEHPINYDVYLSYSVKDENVAGLVKEKLEEIYQNIKLFSQHQDLNDDACWQDEVYEVMASCARVITILTPNYVADSNCLEQYNIALCCSRNMERDYLAPFYIKDIEELPTYMCLIQYFDCRPLDSGKVFQACSNVTDWLQSHVSEIQHLTLETQAILSLGETKEGAKYDVFISYSHQNSTMAQRIKTKLLTFHPSWNIFIDVAELKTGAAWQVKLYNSIEASRIVIVLISPTYLKSKVCQEEFNLASAMHSDFAYSTKLLPLLVETVDMLPSWCRNLTPIDCRDISDKSLAQLIKKVNVFKQYEQLDKPKMTSIEDVTSNWRSEHYRSNFQCLLGLNFEDPRPVQITPESGSVDIALSYDVADKGMAELFIERLTYFLPNVKISLPQVSKVRSTVLDETSIIVPLLSKAYTQSSELSDELNIALCRQRTADSLLLFPIYLESLPTNPAYIRLLWSLFSCNDKVWERKKMNLPSGEMWSSGNICLSEAARVLSIMLTHQAVLQGSFKTLLSVDELIECTLRLRGNHKPDVSYCNPLYFNM